MHRSNLVSKPRLAHDSLEQLQLDHGDLLGDCGNNRNNRNYTDTDAVMAYVVSGLWRVEI